MLPLVESGFHHSLYWNMFWLGCACQVTTPAGGLPGDGGGQQELGITEQVIHVR